MLSLKAILSTSTPAWCVLVDVRFVVVSCTLQPATSNTKRLTRIFIMFLIFKIIFQAGVTLKNTKTHNVIQKIEYAI